VLRVAEGLLAEKGSFMVLQRSDEDDIDIDKCMQSSVLEHRFSPNNASDTSRSFKLRISHPNEDRQP